MDQSIHCARHSIPTATPTWICGTSPSFNFYSPAPDPPVEAVFYAGARNGNAAAAEGRRNQYTTVSSATKARSMPPVRNM